MKRWKGMCRAADPYWGACRLTQKKCIGWRSCPHYEAAMERRWKRPAGLQKFFEVGVESRPSGQAEAGSPNQRPPEGALTTPEPTTAPALGQGEFPMTQSEHTSRTRRAQPLVDLVEKVQGGYLVKSARNAETSYFVSKPNGRIHCTCSDFKKHFQEDASWRCKHIEAAILAHKQGKINGDGRSQAPEAAASENPSPDGTETPEEEASQDLEATVSEFPEEETVPLDSCKQCGRTFTADELFPTNGPDGSSLLCWECMETVSGSRFSVPGLKTSKPGTRNQEPVLTYPCICCGADGLAYREVVPHTMNL